jgi:hypothetical protein
MTTGDYQSFYESLKLYSGNTQGDKVILRGRRLFQQVVEDMKPDRLFFITARGEDGRKPTEAWLADKGFYNNSTTLIMRPTHQPGADGVYARDPNWVGDALYKRQVAQELMRDYHIVLAVDDMKENCDVYRELRIPTVIHTNYINMPSITPSPPLVAPGKV